MALDPLHEQKKRKNYAVLLALFGFVLIIFFVTLVRLKERVRDNMQSQKTSVSAPQAAVPHAK
ncbi:MAG: hypothetical protein KGL10_05130 [Alphaproteobacteria bacterium]|nr:hypothetical protein [Alphaproteobacteria bacterium]MDE2336675.1 hypothetical protein [Alphaproteobacteria bacterium]